MEPLRIQAILQAGLIVQYGAVALDALLAAMYAVVHHMGRLELTRDEPAPLPLPLAREPGGRFDLASFSVANFDQHQTTHFHRAFPALEAKHLTHMRGYNQANGPNKSYRIPVSIATPTDNVLTWFCIGNRKEIECLLQYCHHLGKRRGAGEGKVLRWTVEPCESWGEGFPIMRDGKPLRNLPFDHPGLVEPDIRMTRLTYPYWGTAPNQQPCAGPEGEG